MNKDTLRANKQKALIQDTLRAAFKNENFEGGGVHPFVLAVQSLRREIEFMEPFTDPEMRPLFSQAEALYKSSLQILEASESKIFSDSDVANDAEQSIPLIEYHLNLLKIHRLLFTRQIEGYSLIPPAPQSLQKQVVRTYEALGQLSNVLKSLYNGPKPQKTKKNSQSSLVKSRALITKKNLPNDKEPPIELPERISPFITDGSKKTIVMIDGVSWPRFV